MTNKQSGLAHQLVLSGVLVSNDIQQGTISDPRALLDTTGIDKAAHERIFGLGDGKFDLSAFFNPAAGAIHSVLKTLPRTDVIGTYCCVFGLGNVAGSLVGVQPNYDGTRGADGSFIFKAELDGDGFATDWGVQVTPGFRTDSAATNGTGVDGGAGFATPAVPASLTPVTNTSPLTATVVISGGTMTNVSVAGVTVGAGAGTYTVGAGQAITLTYTVAPTWTWALATAFGWQAWLHVAAFTGSSAVVKLQDSADNTTFTDVTSGAFAAVTGGAPLAARIAVGGTAVLRRFVRVATTGTFTNLKFLVQYTQNLGATAL